MIRIGICEDVLQELEEQKFIVEAIMAKLSVNSKVYCFQSGEDLLCEVDSTGNMDIVLLDIEMEGINGVDTARLIREKDSIVPLIFISSYDQYCKEIISVQPYAFIDKPLDANKLESILRQVIKTRYNGDSRYSFSYNKMQYSIPLSEIRYFQSDKRVILVNTLHRDGTSEVYKHYGKLEDVERKLKTTNLTFLRIRKSCIINPRYIIEYAANKVILDNGFVVEISKQYKEAVRQYYALKLKERPWEL